MGVYGTPELGPFANPNDFHCPHCGAPVDTTLNTRCPFCGKKFKSKGRRNKSVFTRVWFWLILAFVGISIFSIYKEIKKGEGHSGESTITNGPKATSSSEVRHNTPTTKPKATAMVTPTPSASSEQIGKDYIREHATTDSYKDLFRYAEEKTGESIVIKLRISQKLDSNGTVWYRCYSDEDGYGTYYGDEWCVIDGREAGSTRLLVDDIIIVYGTYSGLLSVERALTKTSEEIPAIYMLYVDIEGISPTSTLVPSVTSLPEKNTPTPEGAKATPTISNTPRPTAINTPKPSKTPTSTPSEDEEVTTGQKNALNQVKSYLDVMAFSYSGLKEMLEYSGFTQDEIEYALDHCDADWREQALRQVKSILDVIPYSESRLRQTMEYEGFTDEEIEYAINSCGADWNEQAYKAAEQYMSILSASKKQIVDMLEGGGFTSEQIEYALSKVGY